MEFFENGHLMLKEDHTTFMHILTRLAQEHFINAKGDLCRVIDMHGSGSDIIETVSAKEMQDNPEVFRVIQMALDLKDILGKRCIGFKRHRFGNTNNRIKPECWVCGKTEEQVANGR